MRSELLFEFDDTLIDTEFFYASNNGLLLLKSRLVLKTLRILVNLINDLLSPLLCQRHSLNKLLEPLILLDIGFLNFFNPSHLVGHQRIIDHDALSLSCLSAPVGKFVALGSRGCHCYAYSFARDTGLVFVDIISDLDQAIGIRIL